MKTITFSSVHAVPPMRMIDSMIEQIFANSQVQNENSTSSDRKNHYNLPIDIFEQNNSMFVRAAVPGLDPEQIDITIEDGTLTLKAETQNLTEDENTVYRVREYRSGIFTRHIRLPETIDTQRATAEFNQGFVTISLPLIPEVKPVSFKVPIQVAQKTDKEVSKKVATSTQKSVAAESKPTSIEANSVQG